MTTTEQATAYFYEWEKRGRGWEICDYPVDLEPPFVPFWYHVAIASQEKQPYVDDGKRETILSSIAEGFRSFFNPPLPPPPPEPKEEPFEPFPFQDDDGPLFAFSVTLLKERKVKPSEAEQLLLMLSTCQYPISFEITAKDAAIHTQFICRETDVPTVYSQIKAYFPDGIVEDRSSEIQSVIDNSKYGFIVDYGLAEEFMRPLNTSSSFELDPYIGIFAALENVAADETVTIQILFKGAVNAWSQSIIHAVTDSKGGSFFLDAPEMVPMAKEKISSPFFAVAIRIIGQSLIEGRSERIARLAGDAFGRIYNSEGNKLIPLSSEGYTIERFISDVTLRQSHRVGMLLNSQELTNLVHLPSASVMSLKLQRDTKKTKEAPQIAVGSGYVLGINIHQGKEKVVSLSASQRMKHTHVIGATGTGKSTFLLNCIIQDMQLGNGVAVLDPHGDLIENILPFVPTNRINDVVIIDPADSEYPVGFNILTAHSEVEKDILSSDLVAVFRRLSTSWGDQMNSVFANAILAFLESTEGGTLVDLRRFLVEKSFREAFLKTVTDPSIVYYWKKEFPLLRSNSIAPILTRLDTFLRPKLIRNMVAQKQSLNFEEILDSQKIFLIKLSQGLIGAENSYLLGTFIVSKLQQTAMARQAKAKEDRSDYYVYIDEFQYFITPSMSTILSGARKYHLGLILAHQDMQQLTKQDSELASSVISNAGTRICFRVGDMDAKKFEDGFSFFEAKDLQNLGTGQAIVRIDRPEFDFNLQTLPLPEDDNDEFTEEAKNILINLSRQKYGTPKAEVEKILEGLRGDIQPEVQEEVPKPVYKEEQPKVEEKPIPAEKPEPFIKAVEIPKIEKEESKHRYLQTLIKKMAESRGYKATIELPTPDGKGRVDVALERNGKRIAVEISVTTPEDWEIHNIEKCLAAGYDVVVACSMEKKVVESMQKKIAQEIAEQQLAKILALEPDALFLYLDEEIAKEASTETRVKGYRVKVEYNAVPQDEANSKRGAITKVVAESLKKMKK